MQVKVDGKRNITLDFEAPKKFKLLQDGKEIPYLRTGKNSFRLSRNIDGVLDLEEIKEKPAGIVKSLKIQPTQISFINPNDVLMINQAAQQLEVEQNILGETQKRVEQTQAYLDVQQQRINETVLSVQGLETDNAERISATENGLFNLAGNLAKTEQNLVDSIGIVNNDLQEHKSAENPHGITKKTIGLDKVDNTPDMDKPISKAVQIALDEKANKDEIQAIRDELGEYQEKNDRFTNALSNYTGGLAGNQLPDGGSTGQILAKRTDISGDVEWINSSASITIDDELSLTSKNPVQNKVITNKINSEVANLTTRVGNLETGKQDKLTQVQLDAVNSGATTANIAKISTNETAINNHIANTSNPHSVTKAQVGLGNVDNTSDLNKPISTATQTALNGKQATLVSGTNIKTINNQSLLGSGNINIQGGGAVDSVNGQTGTVVLTASDVGALPDSTVIPTVNNSTISFTQGGVTKGSFTLNQSSGATIDFDASSGAPSFATITGKPTDNANLASALSAKYDASNPDGYQANVIETVKVNGTALTPVSKAVDVTVPTKTSDLTNDDGFITGITSSDVSTALGYTPADDSDVVHRTGDETIAGVKTFTRGPILQTNNNDTGYYIKNTNADITTSPTNTIVHYLRCLDKNSQLIGDLNFYRNTDGSQQTYIRARSAISGSQKSASFGVKTNVDGSDDIVATVGVSRSLANLPMPSSRYTELTLGASGTVYTASDTGWVVIRKQTNSTNQYIRLFIQNSLLGNQISAASSGTDIETYIPVKKGDKFSVGYNAGGTTQRFRFIKAQGVA